MTDNPIVNTRQGLLRGLRDPKGPLRFQGVPFAAPPIGALRFRPPAPPQSWTGVRDALQPGPVAPQEPFAGSTARIDEDCLYLNITTPAADGARRAVLVYVHGGAFIAGAGSSPVYSGVHLAADHDLVVVALNYRLGVLGFPPFSVHGAGEPQNLGLLDQVAALEWVRDNIEAFGGDPERVTLCGYSAGGWSTAALMTAPQSQGLFQRAAPQSGAFMYAMSPSGQAEHAKVFLSALGVAPHELSALMDAPVDRLLAAQARTIEAWQQRVAANQIVEFDFPFTPLRDGVVLAEHPIDAIRRGACAEVPLLVGTTRDECGAAPFRLVLPWMREVHTRANVVGALADFAGAPEAERIWAGYVAQSPDASETELVGRIRSDWQYRVPAIRIAEARSVTAAGAWMYRFDLAGGSDQVGDIATHATDATFWLGSMAQSPYQTFFFGRGPNEDEERLSARMQADLAAFAREGRCKWPRYDLGERQTMVYGHQTGVVADPSGGERSLWDGLI